ncbi:unnamed protein product [Rhodiola kirilowii]
MEGDEGEVEDASALEALEIEETEETAESEVACSGCRLDHIAAVDVVDPVAQGGFTEKYERIQMLLILKAWTN